MLAELLLVHFGFILKSQCFGGGGESISVLYQTVRNYKEWLGNYLDKKHPVLC